MKTVYLYINGKQADLDGDELILMNYTQDDLANPTAVKNSYSRQITLKGTAANNRLFGEIYRMDWHLPGAVINPLRRTPFEIYSETSELLVSGYMRLDKVDRQGPNVSYSVSLYGGLGGFFYSLTYNDDGIEKTLADLDFGDNQYDAEHFKFRLENGLLPRHIMDAWDVMAGADPATKEQPYWNILNFAPAYNGLPEDFDADKMIVRAKVFDNIPMRTTVDGVVYDEPMTGVNSYLVKMTGKHTEWEMKDLRCYLQRPVVSIKAIMEAIARPENNGGYTVEISDELEDSDYSRYYGYGWVTLPLISTQDRYSWDVLLKCLQNTDTPAAYLLSFAKMLGLMFLYDNRRKAVTIMSRNRFYGEYYPDILDLTNIIDTSSISINPIAPETMYYQFGTDEATGEYAAQYKATYKRAYGIQRVNTGYEFDNTTRILTENSTFKVAPEVLEVNRLFHRTLQTYDEGPGVVNLFSMPLYESCTVQLWAKPTTGDDGKQKQENTDCPIPMKYGYTINMVKPYFDARPWSDFAPKVQLHDADNKAADGSGVFLMFQDMVNTPPGELRRSKFVITADNRDMDVLNQNVPCWNFTDDNDTRYPEKFPSFGRFFINDLGEVIDSAEWGIPLELANPQITRCDYSLYNQWWQAYISDRYNAATRVMTCKANLTDMEVGPELLRRICWYEGAYWVINRIVNHSITTDNLTEIELVKVNDVENYITGQNL